MGNGRGGKAGLDGQTLLFKTPCRRNTKRITIMLIGSVRQGDSGHRVVSVWICSVNNPEIKCDYCNFFSLNV